MKRADAISRLHRLLTAKHQPPLSLRRICQELECSQSTAKRCIRDLRDRFAHPIEYDAERGGYYYARSADGVDGWELPGLWFTESELTALLTMRALLRGIHPGIFERQLVPLGERVEQLLEATGLAASEVAHRIRVLAMGRRPVVDDVFRVCADAVLARRRISVLYKPRGRPAVEERREVSPQRLVHYRDNWYLDAWCHVRGALRTFALDRIREPRLLETAAEEVQDCELDEALSSSYGIFAGLPENTAVLRFTPRRARWVAREIWHDAQSGRYLDDGSWELTIPYSRSEELVMDVLMYGSDVEVIEPPELRALIVKKLRAASARYPEIAETAVKQTA